MLPQQYCLRWKYHHSNLQTMFSQLLDRGCFCDVTLACEGQLIRAHRVVLCACSTFFDTVLTNYASERDPIIIMKDVTFADVKCLIEFMYKGEINVEHAHLASLLKTADDLKIKGLAEVSWREDDDGPPPPPAATEFHSPTRIPETYEQHRMSPAAVMERERKSSASPVGGLNRSQHTTRLPTLTPIPSSSSISIAAAAAASVDHYLGPKRKRGRPPLDDTYDVFNIRKMAQYAAHMDHQAYLESRRYAEEQRHQPHPSSTASGASPSTTAAAAAAYQQHIHQQQTKQRMRHRQKLPENEETEHDDVQTDPEWITSNLEVNVAECEPPTPHDNVSDSAEIEVKEYKIDQDEQERKRERSPEQREKLSNGRSVCKNSNAEQHTERRHEQAKVELDMLHREEGEEDEQTTTVPQPVEEIESVQQVMEQQLPTASATTSSSTATSSSSSTQKSAVANQQQPPPPPPPLHHPHFGKYAPEGYLLNEHGMLMTHDFVHAPTASIPASSSAGSSASAAAANGNDDFIDIKMEDYDAADLRLTSEEMSQWQDVIKMDDYLAKGRRPQFWEEPFTRRVLDAIKNKRLEMKKAARILGVSYGTLYGRYREVYGCLKHPYSSTTFRPSQSTPLAVQPRFDIVWPPKRDGVLLPGQLEIGKIRPKDLSELWARPQI